MNGFRLLLVLLFVSTTSIAQNFGGNPPQKWAQVNTNAARVIFPVGMDSVANRIATIADQLQRDSIVTKRFRKINIVLQRNSTVSNAYVQLAPYRSEFYLMAPQNPFELGSMNWADNLIIHEWRHVQQFNYFNRGIARVSTVLLGQEGRALLNGMAIPDWFFEGDAVWNETKYSRQGRGRLPLAFSGYKSLFLEGKHYNYMKLRNGSLKDLVPNHYDLGYLLVAYGAEKYGNDFWNKVTADASAFKPLIYPLQGAIKKYAGIPYKQFVDEALNFYQKQWKQEVEGSELNWITIAKNYRTDYLYPYTDENGDIIAVKQSTKNNPALYRIDKSGKEDRLAAMNITQDRYFSYKNGRVVYAAYALDARWSNREYSNIVVVDVNSKSERKLTSKAKYFSPDISADGKTIVAVEMKESGASRLVVLDEFGSETKAFEAGTGEVFSQPKFATGDVAVYVPVRNSMGQMGLRQYHTGKDVGSTTVLPFGNYIIGFPVVNGDTVLFTATNKMRDDVYAWLESSKKLYHIASYPTGMYQSTFSNGKLIASVFTSNGHRLASLQPKWQQVETPGGLQDLYVDKALESNISVEKIKTERKAFKKYSTLSHPFNFHSWRPYYDQPEFSFTLYGQNVLNTLQTQLSYIYNQNENTHGASGSLIYGGTFFQPFVSLRHTWSRPFVYNADTTAYFNEFEYAGGFQLPLNLSGGRMYRFMNLSASFHSVDVNVTGKYKTFFKPFENDVQYLQGLFSFSSQIQKQSQQIYPHFGIATSIRSRNAVNVKASQLLATGSLFLPGLTRTHSIVLSLAYQGRDTMNNYPFTNNFPYPRGFDGGYNLPRMWKVGANYHFPILHPDWGFANLVYFQRIRLNGYTDYAELQSLRTKAVYRFQSAGGEVFFDTKIWNNLPVTFGFRYNHLVLADVGGIPFNSWEFIVPVNLIP